MIRVVIIDDHAAYRQALAFMLDREVDISVVAQAGDVESARPALKSVDVAIVDLDLAGVSGLGLVSDLKQAQPGAAALIVTATMDRSELGRAVELGAAGVLHKSCGVQDVIQATRTLSSGGFLHSTTEVVELLRLAARKREEDREGLKVISQLTPRERDVLAELAKGKSDQEIAQALSISPETVRTHMVNILRKLNVNSRLEALVVAVRHGAVAIS